MYKPASLIDGNPVHPGLDDVSYLGQRYLRERNGYFSDSKLASKLGALSTSTLLLLPEDISRINIEGTDTSSPGEFSVHLTEVPKLNAGRRNSQHEVQFGQLHISSNSIHPVSELVAIKHLFKGVAPKEFHASREINRRFGSDVALQPIGFVRQPNSDNVGYLTRYEHSVVTLDNVLWNPEANSELRTEAMGFAGLWLASLHNHGIIHGDAQVKNIAYDSTQQLRYVDLEGAHTFDSSDAMSRIERLVDVSDVFNPIFMPKTTKEENDVFIEAYLEQQISNTHYVDGADINRIIEQQATRQPH